MKQETVGKNFTSKSQQEREEKEKALSGVLKSIGTEKKFLQEKISPDDWIIAKGILNNCGNHILLGEAVTVLIQAYYKGPEILKRVLGTLGDHMAKELVRQPLDKRGLVENEGKNPTKEMFKHIYENILGNPMPLDILSEKKK